MAEACHAPLADLERILFNEQLQRRFERGEVSEDGFRQTLEKELGRATDAGALRVAAADIFTVNEPMVPLLDRWKRDGYRLVLLSNTCVTHYEWVLAHFDLLTASTIACSPIASARPSPRRPSFGPLSRRSNVRPHECFYTDDIEEYVLARSLVRPASRGLSRRCDP